MKKNLLLLLPFLFLSCAKSTETSVKVDDVNIKKLFTHDGCTVYRFYDDGRHVYFSDCRGNIKYDSEEKGSNEVIIMNN